MPYFVIQVETGQENRFIERCRTLIAQYDIDLIHLQRRLAIRKKGVVKKVCVSVFPGYVFLKAGKIEASFCKAVRWVTGFTRFLKNNTDITPLCGDDKDIILHLLSFGRMIRESYVRFDINKRIVVVEGPLKGLEGNIVRVDRRKKRAKVRLDLYDNVFEVDFGFELMDEISNRDKMSREPVLFSGSR